MASSITVKEALWRAGVILQDVSPQFVRHPEAEMVTWADDAQLALFKFLPSAGSRVDTLKLKPGTRQSIESIAAADCKPGDGSTPSAAITGVQLLDLVRNMGADGLTPGAAIRPIPRQILDDQTPTWHQILGPVVRQFAYDPATPLYFYINPGVPVGANVWVEVSWIAQPARIPNTGTPGAELYKFDGASTLKLAIADQYIEDVVNYIVARAFMKNAQYAGNDQKASNFAGLFINSLNAKVASLTGQNPNLKFLPFAPEPIGSAR